MNDPTASDAASKKLQELFTQKKQYTLPVEKIGLWKKFLLFLGSLYERCFE